MPGVLVGRRLQLRPLAPSDFEQWRDVRRKCRDWLTVWEPRTLPGQPDPVEDRLAFIGRCNARDRERQLGTGYGFGMFVGERFVGEINLSGVQRGPFQNGYIGYWIDQDLAGQGLVPEAAVVLFRYAFEDLGLHRLQIAVIPRNGPSRRVVEKLNLRDEGLAVRYLEINGEWEDHIRYAITAEEWAERREAYMKEWVEG